MPSKIAGSIGNSAQDGPKPPSGVDAVHDASDVKAVLVNKVAVKRQDTAPTSEPTTTPATSPPKAPSKVLDMAGGKQSETTTAPATPPNNKKGETTPTPTTPPPDRVPAKINIKHVENTEDKSKSQALGSSNVQESSTTSTIPLHQAHARQISIADINAGRRRFIAGSDDLPLSHNIEKRGQGKNGVTKVKKRG